MCWYDLNDSHLGVASGLMFDVGLAQLVIVYDRYRIGRETLLVVALT